MATRIALKQQDSLNRFYTRKAMGALLVDQLGSFTPRNVLDLGAGEGTLSAAVGRRWKEAIAVTVDVDPDIVENLRKNLKDAGVQSHRHHICDVLEPTLPDSLVEHGAFDLAVCNPPFFRPAWNRNFARILQRANLAGACPTIADVSAEILFLAQNLCMVRDGGKIALIAPDGLLTGWRMTEFRRALMAGHSIDCVVQLPNHSFHDTEARCFVLIITKNAGPTQQVKLLRYDAVTGLSDRIMISADDAERRMDFDFHAFQANDEGRAATLRQLGADIKRGSVDTMVRKGANYATFHTSDYRFGQNGTLFLDSDLGLPENCRLIVAEPGDILIARIDRSLHQKVAMVVSGRAVVTDCVYRVRVPSETRKAVFDALRSPAGAERLRSITKGVGARLLGKADLFDLPLGFTT